MNKIEKWIANAILQYNKNSHRIVYDLMDLFRWQMWNYRLRGFSFPQNDQQISELSPHIIMRIDCWFQISDLNGYNEAIQEILAWYCWEYFICAELWVDEKWPYIEVLIDDFS